MRKDRKPRTGLHIPQVPFDRTWVQSYARIIRGPLRRQIVLLKCPRHGDRISAGTRRGLAFNANTRVAETEPEMSGAGRYSTQAV